jgi:hypothetical protein
MDPWKPLHLFLIGGVGMRKTFTLMCIIQSMLQYYIKQMTNVDTLKPKILKLAYIWKVAQQYIQHSQSH